MHGSTYCTQLNRWLQCLPVGVAACGMQAKSMCIHIIMHALMIRASADVGSSPAMQDM